MLTWTNMTRPEDPYRTGQQLYRRPSPQLAAFTVTTPAGHGHSLPYSYAVVYLPLHRTRAVTVTEETVAFGFRTASIDDDDEVHALAAVADLDLMQARRHAAILAGHARLCIIMRHWRGQRRGRQCGSPRSHVRAVGCSGAARSPNPRA